MFSFQITALIISPRDIDTKQNDDIIESTHAHYSPPLAREDTSGILRYLWKTALRGKLKTPWC